MTPKTQTAYLERIGLDRRPEPAGAGLIRVQDAHLASIPFEGIDPFLGTTPDLDPDALADKILHRRRGGYCFELNILFGALLRSLGYDIRRTLARVRTRTPAPGARAHLAWLVAVGPEIWLADVGFGGPAPRHPMRLDRRPQAAPNGTFRLVPDHRTGERVLERQGPGGWHPIYSFDQAHVTDGDVAAANHVTATWHGAPFRSNLMINGYTGATRLGLFNRCVTEEGPDGSARRFLTGAADLASLLARLRLDTSPDTRARIWHRLDPTPDATG